MGVQLSTATISSGGRNRVKIEDFVDLIKFANADPLTLRPVGEIVALATHWFEVITKDGNKIRIGKTCRNTKLDGKIDLNGFDGKGGCAFCAVGHPARAGYFQNQINVAEEDNAPRRLADPTKEEEKTGFKIKGTKLWTPVAVLVFPPMVATTMQGITKKNIDKKQKMRELHDPNFGRALDISNNPDKNVAPANKWSVQKSDDIMRKLTDEQREYWTYDLNLLRKMYPSVKESLEDMKYNVPTMTDKDFETLDLTEHADLIAKRNGGKKKSKGGKFDIDDEDEDDLPKRKKSSRVDDDDDADDDDLPKRKKASSRRDDDDDDQPRKKKKKKSFNMDDVF